MSDRRLELPRDPEQVWSSLQVAAARIGRIEASSEASRVVVMKARQGCDPVRLRVTVLSGDVPGASVLEITGRGQDVMAPASRKVVDRLLLALDEGSLRTG